MDRFSRAGLTFEVRDGGPQDGEAVVLLHGWPQNQSAFDAVVPLLHASGLRTLVPTQRGYTSGARPRERRAYRTEETVADVLALLDAAGLPQAHVVGHDWGGAQAWALGAWHPERALSLTVLSTPHPAAMAASLVSGGQALRSWYMGLFQVPVVPELLVGKVLRRFLLDSHLPEPYVESYCRTMAEPGALTGSLNWYRGLPFSARPSVGPVRVPATYVWGRDDPALGRAAAERTAAHVQGPYRFVELPAGHWLPETRPEDVAEAVLARVGR
ncbi:MAG TPA: alpha/beta fold hydrolase [Actinomycetales bacterium]|nr:alpha/beta fold hydrolase [Actinomycetales bacterium]